MKTITSNRLLATQFIIGILMFFLLLPVPGAVQAEGQVTLDFRDVELSDLVQTVSELTGKNFLYDDRVKGKVTIVSPDSMSLEEAYQLFLSVLYVKGFTIVPSGKVNKIVPIKGAKSENLPTVVGGKRQNSDQFVTRLVRLQHLDAATIANSILGPLVPAAGNLLAYPPTNTLIITDSGANIDRLMRIIRELDIPGSASVLEVIPLFNADSEEVAKICAEIINQPGATRARRVRKDATPAAQEDVSKIISYKRTNSLIVMTNPDDLALIKGLISRMDQDSDSKRSNINLYYLENADAETLAATLNEILTGIKAQTRNAGKDRDNKGPLSSAPLTITADKPTNSLIINARPEDYATLQEIIKKLDIKRKQVYVEALILELSMDATQRLGVSLQGAASYDDDGLIFGSSNQNTGPLGLGDGLDDGGTGGVPSLLTRAVDGLLAGGFFNPITVTGPNGNEITVPTLSVLIDISKTDSDVNILSAPRLLTSDNEEAEIIVGANVPIITGRLTDTGSDGLAQSVSVERQDVALVLRFTPQVTEGDLVRLSVYQELTDIVPATAGLTASVGDPNEVGPTFTKRVLRNTVLAENGKTVVLGGLIDTSVTESVTKVPLLGDIPLLGWLFRRTSTTEEKTNLLVFINPTIIKDTGDLARITGRNRQAASGFLDDKVIDALPENFFGELGNSPEPEAPGVKTATDTDDTIQTAPVESASGESSNWATPPPRRVSE
ncbi:MAG: type II secretion system protein GspD [Deltaproteobacteria bacterium]|nr:MAG: type II secretion system protein GspD [Deltaproteobacteria bacterium]